MVYALRTDEADQMGGSDRRHSERMKLAIKTTDTAAQPKRNRQTSYADKKE